MGRRPNTTKSYLAAIVCDGMGGLEHGDDAADLAIASAGAILCSPAALSPENRMQQAILSANRTVFDKYRGRAGAVLAAALVDGQTLNQSPVIGWVGDARAYGLTANNGFVQLTRDDTVAAQIEALEGVAPEAMNQPLQAIGAKPDVRPNIAFSISMMRRGSRENKKRSQRQEVWERTIQRGTWRRLVQQFAKTSI